MQQFSFSTTSIAQLMLIHPFLASDNRGYLSKSFERGIFEEHGIYLTPYEELTSCSRKGVLRGLHFQRKHSQDKLIRVLSGVVYDVAVDLRRDSSTFGQWQGFTLSAENQNMLYIPKGFAHGFLALEEETVLNYLCGEQYDPTTEDGIIWNDPALSISWPTHQVDQLFISERDQTFKGIRDMIGEDSCGF